MVKSFVCGKLSLRTVALLFLLFTSSAACLSQERLLHTQTWYGDNMGDVDENTPTKTIQYMYDADNRLVRKVQNGLRLESEDWVLTNYYRLNYDDAGLLTSTSTLQYTSNDTVIFYFKEAGDEVLYEYDNEGHLVKETDSKVNTYYVYEYEGDNLVKSYRWRKGKNDLTLTYSDFCKGGPQKVVADATADYNKYTGEMTYDAQGHKLSEKHWNLSGTLNYAEYWTYDDSGFLTCYEKKGISSGNEVNASKVDYTKTDEYTSEAKSYTWKPATSQWNFKGGSKVVSKYADFKPKSVPAIVSATPDNSKAQVVLSLTNAEGGANIYRNGILVGQAKGSSFTDTKVPNGEFEYFAQAIEGGQGMNVSNIVTAAVARKYPAPSGLRATTAKLNSDGTYSVSLAWTCPAVTADMDYVYTNIMKIGTYGDSPLLDDLSLITDPKTNTAEVNFNIDPVQRIYVLYTFKGGSSRTATLSVNATELIGRVDAGNRRLNCVETWDGSEGLTERCVTFYGTDDDVVAEGRYVKGSDGNWTLSAYTGSSDYGFDESGNMVSKCIHDKVTGTDQTVTYSDFVGVNLPSMTVSTGSEEAMKYMITTEYNEAGLKVSEKMHTWDSSTSQYVPCNRTVFDYDDGELQKETVYSITIASGQETYTEVKRTEYAAEQSDPNRMRGTVWLWDESNKTFRQSADWIVNEFTDIDAGKYAPELTLVPSDNLSSVRLEVVVPDSYQSAMTALNIYRNGEIVAYGVSYMDAKYYETDKYGMNGKFVFTDSNLRNGTYEYFVQLAQLNATMDTETSQHNVSEVRTHTCEPGTGISSSALQQSSDHRCYNLAGQQIKDQQLKGIVIINNRKTVQPR